MNKFKTANRRVENILYLLHLARFISPIHVADPRRPERVFWREGSPESGMVPVFGDPSRQKTRSGRRRSENSKIENCKQTWLQSPLVSSSES
ncbi:hypothetical protein Lsha_2808 [Legionella shakespearei DSM 23087]|uniref:Uncharacterized protein n=1 Tax=Legionella shakespearei DSM 23087 TaxID=1122169 RepID=A0A0W0YHI3_9GAMM|nr:hypothetical protein Lsha_2808 [Legionella shakespearei DSM 23087]